MLSTYCADLPKVSLISVSSPFCENQTIEFICRHPVLQNNFFGNALWKEDGMSITLVVNQTVIVEINSTTTVLILHKGWHESQKTKYYSCYILDTESGLIIESNVIPVTPIGMYTIHDMS